MGREQMAFGEEVAYGKGFGAGASIFLQGLSSFFEGCVGPATLRRLSVCFVCSSGAAALADFTPIRLCQECGFRVGAVVSTGKA
jgi:hypothetical protein